MCGQISFIYGTKRMILHAPTRTHRKQNGIHDPMKYILLGQRKNSVRKLLCHDKQIFELIFL